MSGPSALQLMETFSSARDYKDLWGDDALLKGITKIISKASAEEAPDSNQSRSSGVRYHLLNKEGARELQTFNPHHSAALAAKADSSVGLGHRDQSIYDVLDPLCVFSWQDTMDAVAQDLVEGGDGYLEVVRAGPSEGSPIVAIYHVDAHEVYVSVEQIDNGRDFHYLIEGHSRNSRLAGGSNVVMAKFGDLPDLRRRFNDGTRRPVGRPRTTRRSHSPSALEGEIVNSEIIHFRLPTNRSRYYGYPDYLSAVPSIELVQCMTQERFDFFFNRGVPEFLLFLFTRNITDATWKEFQTMMKAHQGQGNSHQSNTVHIPGTPEDSKIQVEKMALDARGDAQFKNDNETLAMNIVTAHRIPPILAGVMIPGKMGGNNEGPNSLMLFQKQVLDKLQRLVSRTLACTLGLDGVLLNTPTEGEKSLTRDQFLGTKFGPIDDMGMPQHAMPGNGFRTVLDGMSLGAMKTMSTMREPLVGSDRDPNDGPLTSQDDRQDGDPRGRGAGGASASEPG